MTQHTSDITYSVCCVICHNIHVCSIYIYIVYAYTVCYVRCMLWHMSDVSTSCMTYDMTHIQMYVVAHVIWHMTQHNIHVSCVRCQMYVVAYVISIYILNTDVCYIICPMYLRACYVTHTAHACCIYLHLVCIYASHHRVCIHCMLCQMYVVSYGICHMYRHRVCICTSNSYTYYIYLYISIHIHIYHDIWHNIHLT